MLKREQKIRAVSKTLKLGWLNGSGRPRSVWIRSDPSSGDPRDRKPIRRCKSSDGKSHRKVRQESFAVQPGTGIEEVGGIFDTFH